MSDTNCSSSPSQTQYYFAPLQGDKMQHRRAIIVSSFLITFGVCELVIGKSNSKAKVQYEIEIEEDHRAALKEAGLPGVSSPDKTKNPTAIILITGAVLLPVLVNAVITLRDRLTNEGVIVDARGKSIKIRKDNSIPRGSIIVVDKNGTHLLEQNDPKVDSTALLTALLGALKK